MQPGDTDPAYGAHTIYVINKPPRYVLIVSSELIASFLQPCNKQFLLPLGLQNDGYFINELMQHSLFMPRNMNCL